MHFGRVGAHFSSPGGTFCRFLVDWVVFRKPSFYLSKSIHFDSLRELLGEPFCPKRVEKATQERGREIRPKKMAWINLPHTFCEEKEGKRVANGFDLESFNLEDPSFLVVCTQGEGDLEALQAAFSRSVSYRAFVGLSLIHI